MRAPFKKMFVVVPTTLILASCGFKATESSNISQTTYGAALKYSKVDVNSQPLDKTVCDPFNNVPANNLEQGIRASLHYLTPGMTKFSSSLDYVSSAKKSDQKLFFADMNVPTRAFTEGFATQTNDVLKDDAGAKLIEYFAVKFDTVLRLSANDEEGDYEIAALSDDGATLKIGSGALSNPVYSPILSNEGDHETKMGCSSQVVHMTRDTSLPIQLSYYQGPRYFISNVVMWRKASVAGKDSECGNRGNSLFFDADRGSEPQAAYKGLISRGWKVIAKENFFIPANETYNPCVEGTKPVISNFQMGESLLTGVYLSWKTDIPATSQIKLVNKATGEVILTQADNALRTSHSVLVQGLAPGSTYTAQAVSVSEDLGHSLSSIIEVMTQ